MLLTIKELEDAAVLHPDILEYAEKNPRPQLSGPPTVAHTRKAMDVMETTWNVWTGPAFTGFESHKEIPMRDGFMSSLKIQRPPDGSKAGPLIVLLFGGGFVGGTNEQFSKFGRVLANLFGATVVSIAYRLGPEWKFPYSQHDTQDTMQWIASNANDPILNADPGQGFIMGGVSAGASLTAAFSRIFQDSPLPYPLTGQWLSVPSLAHADIIPEQYKPYYLSTVQQAKNPFFSQESREFLRTCVEWDITSPMRYALNSTNELKLQPKTYFQIDGADPLRDDGLIYDEMLKEAGVETRVDFYPGCPHAHFCGFPGLEITDRANVDTMVGMGWLLGKSVSREAAAKELGL